MTGANFDLNYMTYFWIKIKNSCGYYVANFQGCWIKVKSSSVCAPEPEKMTKTQSGSNNVGHPEYLPALLLNTTQCAWRTRHPASWPCWRRSRGWGPGRSAGTCATTTASVNTSSTRWGFVDTLDFAVWHSSPLPILMTWVSMRLVYYKVNY